MTHPVIDQLVQRWGRPAAGGKGGASFEAVRTFESRYSVALPDDLREYVRRLDGTGPTWPTDADEHGFNFWPLSRIRPVPDELAAFKMDPITGLDQYFVFADYREWSWAYAIRLTRDGSKDNPVVPIGKGKPVPIANSFSGFLLLYLRDAKQLYRETL